MTEPSGLEQLFFSLWALSDGHERRPAPVREFRFDDARRWRFDFAWPDLGVAVELCGVMDEDGKYRRARGLSQFFEKLNAAAASGWTVLMFTSLDLQERPVQVREQVEGVLHLHAESAAELSELGVHPPETDD